jgi:spore germination protein YaaH
MAHDYEPLTLPDYEMKKGNPITPIAAIDAVYYSLKAICDHETGVADLDKVVLALSFDTARWTLQNGVVTNRSILHSDGPSIYKRLLAEGTEKLYSTAFQSPYIRYYDPADTTTNVVWYEDERSFWPKRP